MKGQSTSEYIGVSWHRKNQKWEAKIRWGHWRRVHLGFFSEPIDAARAYNTAALELVGQFAVINHIDGDEWLQKHQALQSIEHSDGDVGQKQDLG
jgi:hypothetical protein